MTFDRAVSEAYIRTLRAVAADPDEAAELRGRAEKLALREVRTLWRSNAQKRMWRH